MKKYYFASFLHGTGYGNAYYYVNLFSSPNLESLKKHVEEQTGSKNVSIMFYKRISKKEYLVNQK